MRTDNICLVCQKPLLQQSVAPERILYIGPAQAHGYLNTQYARITRVGGKVKVRGGIHHDCWNNLVKTVAPHLVRA